MFKRFSVLFIVSVLVLSVVGTAFATDDGPNAVVPGNGGIGGIVPPHGDVTSDTAQLGNGKLTYHGGPIMHTNVTYAIYWLPAGYSYAGGYIGAINQYFIDVAAASLSTTNVYYAASQYYSLPGPVYVTTKSTFGGAYLDTQAFPASGCSLYTSGITKCLTDRQIRAEIKRVMAVKGWVAGPSRLFFMFTPYGVGSCSGSSCAFTSYCAYHGNDGALLYANQPYTYTKPSNCGLDFVTASSPHGLAADSTINVVSHEHNEAMTDPKVTSGPYAWYDAAGYENGDKCAWNFGPLGIGYNQTINGHHYILQKEWSNHSNSCRLTGR